jgi:ribosome maturation factor RimP
MTLLDGSVATGRVGETRDDAVALVVRDGRGWAVREIALTDVITAVVQVEFSPPSPVELALAQTPLAGETAEETAGKEAGT